MALHTSERGQAIVLLVLLLVGLLGVTALAVDGGRLYYSRRTAQNAADNAALAGAYALCTGGSVATDAFASAATNGFNNDGVSNTVAVHHPPSSGPNTGDTEYVEVVINSQEETAFAQLVYSGAFETTVRAVGHCGEKTEIPARGKGIVVLDEDDDCALDVDSNAQITVNDGGIFSNSADDNGALCLSSNAEISADTSIDLVGGWRMGSNSEIDPTPNTGVPSMADPLEALAPPARPEGSCNPYSIGGNDNDTIDPGLYCFIEVDSNATLELNPGIYYIEGGNVEINSNGVLEGTGVMFYLDSGDFIVDSNGTLDIQAPTSGPYAGMMLFMDRDTGGNITLSSNGSISTAGTIYAANSHLEMQSNNVLNLEAQLIVNTLELNSNSAIVLTYDEEKIFQGGPPVATVELAE